MMIFTATYINGKAKESLKITDSNRPHAIRIAKEIGRVSGWRFLTLRKRGQHDNR